MHANDVAPGQDAPADRNARADKTRESAGQMSAGEAAVLAQEKGPSTGETRDPSATPRRTRTGTTKRTVSRGRSGGKGAKTKRKPAKAGGIVRRGTKQGGRSTGVKGRAKAAKGPKKSARKTTSKKPTKKRAGTGKAGGKRNR